MEDINSLNQLLNGSPSGTTTPDITGQISQILAWVIIPSIVLTIVMIGLYVLHIVHRRKIDSAILEIREILRDMQQAQTTSIPTPPATVVVDEQSDTVNP